jgi:DNA-binding CsgD family transcriptional regulator
MLKEFLKTLTDIQKIIYLHNVKGLTQAKSAQIIGMSQVQVSRIRNSIYSKILAFADKKSKLNQRKADQFALTILGSRSDDEIANELKCDLATVKICREILKEIDLIA